MSCYRRGGRMGAQMAALYLGIILVIPLVHCAPCVEEWFEGHLYPCPDPTPPPDPVCEATFDYDTTGFTCNDDRTGYYYCDYDYQVKREESCPSGTRCKCSSKDYGTCYRDSKDDRIPGTPESEVCEKLRPPERPLPDPAHFHFRSVRKSEWEGDDGHETSIDETKSGEVRQDIKNGKYMRLDHTPYSNFHLILQHKEYNGNMEQKTCTVTKTNQSPPYWNVDKYLGDYKIHREWINGGEISQTWIKPGSSRWDADEYFYVSVKDGYTLLGRYSVSEGRDWEEESLESPLSRDADVYYNTTYGVDSSHWFDVPPFCPQVIG